MKLLAPLPLPLIRGFGALVGTLLYGVMVSRRRVVLTNLRLCFPGWSEAERRRVARRNVRCFVQALFDRSWLWHGSLAVVRRRLKLVGALDDLRRDGAVVMFAPHFYGMDAGGSAVMDQIDRAACTIYSTQTHREFDAWMQAGRRRFGQATLFARTEGLKPVVRALRQGQMLYLLPDMDLGPEESVFVAFFGIETATVPSLARFAQMGRARVVPVVTRMTSTGYEVQVHPAWQDYPSGDLEADTARMNRELQGWIEAVPDQYYWVHKRFKTRPAGESSFYG